MSGLEINFTVEDRLFDQALRNYARDCGKEFGAVVKQGGRLLAVNLAFQTQPFGDGPDAKLMGEKAVTRDLARVYGTAGTAYRSIRDSGSEEAARAFYKAMLQGDWKKAREILQASSSRWRNVPIGPFDSSLHQKSRNNRGRVNRHVPAQIATNFRKEDTYRNRKLRLVGFAKAGWAAAAMALTGNTRGVPQWVTRHKSRAPGSAVDNSGAFNNPHVIITNDVSYIRSVCPPSQQASALRIQRGKMESHMRKVHTEVARKNFSHIATVTA